MKARKLVKKLFMNVFLFAGIAAAAFLLGITERAQAATLQDLFDGASISALDKDFTDWEQSFIAGPGIDPSKIEVTALEDKPLNPGLLFTAEPGAIVGDGADGESSRISFNYTVTSNGNPINGNELELIDFSFEGELGPITLITIGEGVSDVNDNDIGFKEVRVTRNTEVLFDDLDFEVPQQSIVVETFIQVDGRQTAIAQINQYSQRFSQAATATVIFENGTTKAIGIKNLEFEGTLYNVEFTSTGTVAAEVYGEFPGQFTFDLPTTAFDAADAVNRELNLAGATGVGAEGSAGVPFFWIGFDSELGIDPINEVVFYQPSFYGETAAGPFLWLLIQDSANSTLYNWGTGVWAKFTEASTELQVIFEGNNATGIRNLEVDGKVYDVEFRYDSAENVYGDPPIFDFQEDGIDAARRAVIDALNSEPAVETVGPEKADVYRIGFNVKGPFVEVTQDYYQVFGETWTQGNPALTFLTSLNTYAAFTEVSAPPSGDVVRVFVTDTTYFGNIGGLAGADAKCQERAENAGLTGTWTAWLSTTTEDAIDRIPDGRYELLDGTVIADDKADLTDGTLNAPVNLNQDGNPISGDFVWTGTNLLGRSTGTNCSNWTTTGGDRCVDGDPDCGDRGLNTATNPDWTKVGGAPNSCNSFFHLYCFGGGQ